MNHEKELLRSPWVRPLFIRSFLFLGSPRGGEEIDGCSSSYGRLKSEKTPGRVSPSNYPPCSPCVLTHRPLSSSCLWFIFRIL